MKKYCLLLLLIAASFLYADQPWFYYYKLGIENFKNNQYDLAITAFNKAIELNAHSSTNARTYGMNFIEYYPYFYKASSLFHMQMYNEAKYTLDLELKQKEIQNSKSIYNQALLLKEKIDAELSKSRVNRKEEIQPANQAIEPSVDNENAKKNDDSLHPPPDKQIAEKKHTIIDDEIKKEYIILRKSMANYFNGEYELAINQLSKLPEDMPAQMVHIKNFFLGCSYASIYYLQGEKNSELLLDAKSHFRKVEFLPPQFESRMSKLISPKIITLFIAAR